MTLRPPFVALVASWIALPVSAQIPVYEGPGPDAVVQYGEAPLQYGELRLPAGAGPFPVAVTIHGGCWLDRMGQGSLTPMAAALTEHGIATWDVNYRRLGHDGGGWPGSFLDVGAAVDHLRRLAEDHPIDLERVVLVGHSSGAHLAVWAAGRPDLSSDSEIRGEDPLPVRAAVAIDGPTDLAAWGESGVDERVCGEPVITRLMGGDRSSVPARYRQASPVEMPPLSAAIYLVPAQMVLALGGHEAMLQRADQTEEDVTVLPVSDSDHFQLITPAEEAFGEVSAAIRMALEMPGAQR